MYLEHHGHAIALMSLFPLLHDVRITWKERGSSYPKTRTKHHDSLCFLENTEKPCAGSPDSTALSRGANGSLLPSPSHHLSILDNMQTLLKCPRGPPNPANQTLGGRGGAGVSQRVCEHSQLLHPVDWLVPPDLKWLSERRTLTRGASSLYPRLAVPDNTGQGKKYQVIPGKGNPRCIY